MIDVISTTDAETGVRLRNAIGGHDGEGYRYDRVRAAIGNDGARPLGQIEFATTVVVNPAEDRAVTASAIVHYDVDDRRYANLVGQEAIGETVLVRTVARGIQRRHAVVIGIHSGS